MLPVSLACCKQLDADVLSTANAANLQDLLYLACCAPQPATAVEQLLEQCQDLLQLPNGSSTRTHPRRQAAALPGVVHLMGDLLQRAVSKGSPDLVAALARVPAAAGIGGWQGRSLCWGCSLVGAVLWLGVLGPGWAGSWESLLINKILMSICSWQHLHALHATCLACAQTCCMQQ